MTLRRIFASLLVLLFVIVSVPTFVVFGVTRTFLDANFYNETVVPPVYELLLNVIAYNIYEKDPVIQKYFKEEDIRKVVSESISLEQVKSSMNQFYDDLQEVRQNPEHPLTFDLKPYRAGLVKVAERLAIHLFQSLPACKRDEVPQFSEEGIATCVPAGINYDVVAGPLSKQFETAVRNSISDTADLSLARDQNGSTYTMIFSSAEKVKFYAMITLMILIVLMAFIIYKPFSMIVRYEGVAFLVSGILGFITCILLAEVPMRLVQMYITNNTTMTKSLGGETILVKYFKQIFDVFIWEVQKISFVFFVLGGFLLFVTIYFLRKNSNYISE